MKKFLLVAALCLTTTAWAQTGLTYDFTAENDDGTTIYYIVTTADEDTQTFEVEVAGEERRSSAVDMTYYVGHVVIPDEVYWEGGYGNTLEHYWTQFPAATYKVTAVGVKAFYYCTQLTEVTIGANVRSLGHVNEGNSVSGETASCFFHCTALERVNFCQLNNLSFVGEMCFSGCTALRSIVLPEGVTELAGWAFDNCAAMTSVVLPEGVNALDDFAFRGCAALRSVTMPATVGYVGYNAFCNCTALRRVVMLGAAPPDIDYSGRTAMFEGDTQGVNIYVPTTALAAYTAGDWGNLTNTALVPYASALPLTLSITDGPTDGTTAGDDDGTDTSGGTGLAFATLYEGEYDTLLPVTLAAYIITDVTADGELTLTQLTDDTTIPSDGTSSDGTTIMGGGTIPAATAALIAGAVGTYSDLILVSDDSDGVGANLLYGSDVATTTTVLTGTNAIAGADDADYYFYKLTTNAQGDTDSAGFYWGAPDGAPFEMPAAKAWLAIPRQLFYADGVKGLRMKFPTADDNSSSSGDGNADGISCVGASPKSHPEGIYTLQGVRVSAPAQPGVYIVDGRKVLVK